MGNDIVVENSAAVSPPIAETISVGQILRQARLAKNKTEADVAAYLRLSTKVVMALEDDKYEELPGLTFVCGYLRSYASYLDLSGDDIVARFKMLGIVEPDRLLPAAITLMKKETSIGDGFMRFVSYIIIFVLAGLVILWWYNHSAADQGAGDGNASELAANDSNVSSTTDNSTALPANDESKTVETVASPNNTPVSAPSPGTPAAPLSATNVEPVTKAAGISVKGEQLSAASPSSSKAVIAPSVVNTPAASTNLSEKAAVDAKALPVISPAPTNIVNTSANSAGASSHGMENTSSLATGSTPSKTVSAASNVTNPMPQAVDSSTKVKKTRKPSKPKLWVEPQDSSTTSPTPDASASAASAPKADKKAAPSRTYEDIYNMPEFRH